MEKKREHSNADNEICDHQNSICLWFLFAFCAITSIPFKNWACMCLPARHYGWRRLHLTRKTKQIKNCHLFDLKQNSFEYIAHIFSYFQHKKKILHIFSPWTDMNIFFSVPRRKHLVTIGCHFHWQRNKPIFNHQYSNLYKVINKIEDDIQVFFLFSWQINKLLS